MLRVERRDDHHDCRRDDRLEHAHNKADDHDGSPRVTGGIAESQA